MPLYLIKEWEKAAPSSFGFLSIDENDWNEVFAVSLVTQ
jgi:hypothetical protein